MTPGIPPLKLNWSRPGPQTPRAPLGETHWQAPAHWVTVGSKLNLVHFLIDARVYLPNEILKGVF